MQLIMILLRGDHGGMWLASAYTASITGLCADVTAQSYEHGVDIKAV